ncbi:cupin domain-containing protein, partial [Shewanella abyssi]|uniref:cupin domain-containing protein n=1 Tax=Shewanella abyssi TaxID=311789 RepID=UPI00200C1F24
LHRTLLRAAIFTSLRSQQALTLARQSKQGVVRRTLTFDKHDLKVVRVSTHTNSWRQGIGGLEVMPLHEFEHEHVALVKWPAGEHFQAHRHFGGEEIFVISGEFNDEHGAYPQYTWLRSPHMSEHFPFVERETIIFVKTGHLYLAE